MIYMYKYNVWSLILYSKGFQDENVNSNNNAINFYYNPKWLGFQHFPFNPKACLWGQESFWKGTSVNEVLSELAVLDDHKPSGGFGMTTNQL